MLFNYLLFIEPSILTFLFICWINPWRLLALDRKSGQLSQEKERAHSEACLTKEFHKTTWSLTEVAAEDKVFYSILAVTVLNWSRSAIWKEKFGSFITKKIFDKFVERSQTRKDQLAINVAVKSDQFGREFGERICRLLIELVIQ